MINVNLHNKYNKVINTIGYPLSKFQLSNKYWTWLLKKNNLFA